MASIRTINNKKGISYKIEVSLGYDSNGKKLRQTTTYVPDPGLTRRQQEKAVQKFAYEFEERAKNGSNLLGDKMTFEDFIGEWLTLYASRHLEETTLARYRQIIQMILLPELGQQKIGKITPYHLERFFHKLSEDGVRRDGKPGGYTYGTLKKIRTVLSSIFTTAEKWELINDNPCRKTMLPKDSGAETVHCYTGDQIRRFLQFLDEEARAAGACSCGCPSRKALMKLQNSVLIHIAVFAGLRRGELIGLSWNQSIDYENNAIHVVQSAIRLDGANKTKVPKTKGSIRKVTLPQNVMELLADYQHKQELYQTSLGESWQGNGWVFIQADGSRMNPGSPYQNFHRAIERYNCTVPEDLQLPVLKFHDLRHTNATLLVSSNQVDIKTVSQKLGHASVRTTMEYYVHSYEEKEQQTADILDAMINDAHTRSVTG